jgi:hypothetical protein
MINQTALIASRIESQGMSLCDSETGSRADRARLVTDSQQSKNIGISMEVGELGIYSLVLVFFS